MGVSCHESLGVAACSSAYSMWWQGTPLVGPLEKLREKGRIIPKQRYLPPSLPSCKHQPS